VTAGEFDIYLDAAAGFTINFVYCEGVPSQPGVQGPPIDVTGWHAALTVRSSYGDGAAVTVNDTDLGGITVGTTDGLFVVSFTGAQTSEMPSQGVYDLLGTPPAAEPVRLVQGKLYASLAATRP
jgi:hypothetical protein